MNEAHQELQRLSITWAREQGFLAVANEVRVPRSNYRADVAGYMDRRRAARYGFVAGDDALGVTAIWECKASRADFLKDARAAEPTRERLRELEQRRATLERLLKVHYPSLRRGETLFAEFDAWDWNPLVEGGADVGQHATYASVIREMTLLQRRLLEKTKFERMLRYQCANLSYLVALPDVLDPIEVPVGWGLLVRQGDALQLERKPVWQPVAAENRLKLLERLAAAGLRHIPKTN